MSWMDSWSRPSKSQATPPPFYLLPGGNQTKYCKSCGRVVGRKAVSNGKDKERENATPPAYCSVKCRARKPGIVDREIESFFVDLLRGSVEEEGGERMKGGREVSSSSGYKGGKVVKGASKKKKGESRILVMCDEVERQFFKRTEDPEKTFGRRKNRVRRGVKDDAVWKSVDMEDDWEREGVVRRRVIILVDSDGEERTVERTRTTDEEGAESHDDSGTRLSLDSTVAESAKLNQERLSQLKEEKDLSTWLHNSHETIKVESLKSPSTPSKVIKKDDVDIEPKALASTSVGEADVDADVLARLSIRSGTRIRPSQTVSEVNGGVGGEKGVKERIVENEEMLAKRLEGQRKAEEREQVRCAARRLVAFGYLINQGKENEQRLLCEAVMKGEVVESSFAKGDWGVRWRE